MQEVWMKTSRHKCHINFELSLQPLLHHVSGLQELDKCTDKLFSIRGKTPVLRLFKDICKHPPLSFSIISESDMSGDNSGIMETTTL